MRARSIALVLALGSTLLYAEDFSLTRNGFGPITVHTTLTYEGKGERLVATAVNDSGQLIPYVKLCVTADTRGCLFQMWNTEQWEPGKPLSWNVESTRHVPTLAHQVKIDVLDLPPAAATSAASTPETPRPTPVNQASTVRPAPGSSKLELDVTIIDRHDSATRYTYVVPSFSHATSNTNVNCFDGVNTVNCSGTTRTSGSSTPARAISYEVRGATLALQLPDGRIAVVNCDSKYAFKLDYINRRSCRGPLVDQIRAEFDGDNAKLKWSVSLDGKTIASETYKILAVIDRP
jgi:hypothetical protein